MGERITLHYACQVNTRIQPHSSTREKFRNMRIEWQAAMQFSSPSFIHTTHSTMALSVCVSVNICAVVSLINRSHSRLLWQYVFHFIYFIVEVRVQRRHQ